MSYLLRTVKFYDRVACNDVQCNCSVFVNLCLKSISANKYTCIYKIYSKGLIQFLYQIMFNNVNIVEADHANTYMYM